jgi:tRNA1Val (adenine37-N6)-methyltransferase
MDFEQTRFWQHALHVWQPKRGQGYRFNLDPVLLYGFMQPAEHVLDIGSGTGILALLLLVSGKAQKVTCVEVQPVLAEWAQRNAHDHGLQHRMHVECADVRTYEGGLYDAVVCNPPYFARASHVPSREPSRDIARHEVLGTLNSFVSCASRHLKPMGNASFVVPFQRKEELFKEYRVCGLTLQRARDVHPREGTEPGHVLSQACAGGVPHEQEPPLCVHTDVPNVYHPEVASWLAPPSKLFF